MSRMSGERPDDGFHLPATISPEAQDVLRSSYSRSGRAALAYPAAADVAGWHALWSEREEANLPLAEALVRRFAPTIAERSLAGVPVLDIRPRGWVDDGRAVVYLHGGCYVLGSARSSRRVSVPMAVESGLRVVSVDYTLAPKGRWQQVTAQVANVVRALVGEGVAPNRIALWGDSAGGALSVVGALRLRDEGDPLPGALLLWSPWSDVSEVGDTYRTLREEEPLYLFEQVLSPSAAAYADPAEHTHPYVSPVYADFTPGLVPTLIQVGTKEAFLSNAVRLYRALHCAGVPVTLDPYEGMWHVFQEEIDMPEARLARKNSAAFLQATLPRLSA